MIKHKVNKTTKQFSLLSIVLCFISCNFSTKETNAQEMKKDDSIKTETIDDYTDDYTITPNIEHPKFKVLSEAFTKQKHRFEIDACEFKYNGQSFFIGDSMEKIVKIFGEPHEEMIETSDGNFNTTYLKNKVSLRFDSSKEKLISFLLWLNITEATNDLFPIIFFRGVPHELNMSLNEFLELSDLNHDKLKRTTTNFFMLQRECPQSKSSRVYTSIDSSPSFDSKGGGHLTLRGSFDPNSSEVITSLYMRSMKINGYKKLIGLE